MSTKGKRKKETLDLELENETSLFKQKLQYFRDIHDRYPRDWKDYFITSNGKIPSEEDFVAAKQSGEYVFIENHYSIPEREGIGHRFESITENSLFSSRWVLAPLYLGLIVSIIVIVIRFFMSLVHLLAIIPTGSVDDITFGLLGLLDLALIGNLFIIVMFVGYDNFVSRLDPATESGDKPKWLGHEDFTGLKLKIIGSLVAIASIELLRDFLDAAIQKNINGTVEFWRVTILLTFVVSGLLFALMDYFATKRHMYEVDEEVVEKEFGLSNKSVLEESSGVDE